MAVVALVGASFVLPGVFDRQDAPVATQGHGGMAAPAEGDGLEPGSPVPAFAERDVETGRAITSKSLAGKRTLLFFSEGVMCQACFEQIKGLEQMSGELDKRGIELVSITPDSPADLKQAIGQYGITTPMIADDDRDMSAAFDTLGLGMHADTPGHAFALIDEGEVLWYRDYWLPPERTMYVEPAQVLADLPSS
ncbi:MAG: redoxin domain-containing protein [Gaiellaceae bacterium]